MVGQSQGFLSQVDPQCTGPKQTSVHGKQQQNTQCVRKPSIVLRMQEIA